MRARLFSFALLVTAGFILAPAAFGQANLQVSVTANGSFSGVLSGGSVSITSTGIGEPVQGTAIIRYSGASSALISGITLTNTSEIALQFTPTLPVTLARGGSTSFTFQYLPSSGNLVTAQISIAVTEGGQSPTTFLFSVNGTSPRMTYSYAVAGGTSNSLPTGGTIAFPATNAGSSSTAVVTLSNGGSASASLTAASVNGAAFQFTSPAPSQILPGQQITVPITFAPTSAGAVQGQLNLSFSGSSVSFALAGTAASPSLSASYAFSNGNVHALTSGTAITYPAIDINATVSATVTIVNQGTGSGTLSAVTVNGAAFQTAGLPALPATIQAGQSLSFGIAFSPTQSGSYNGTFAITMTGAAITGALSASTAASNISLAYIDPTTNNVVPLQNSGALQFPSTLVGSQGTVTLVASNSGAGTGSINAVAVTGSTAFQPLNLPALPAAVGPNQQVRFAVGFSPTQQQAYTGALAITINNQTTAINLAGTGIGPQYSYTISGGATPLSVSSGGTITIANTNIGQTTTASIIITNNGTANGQISAISVTGQGLAVSGLPPLPVTLAPSGTQQFTLTYAPTQPGQVTGKLFVGGDSFTLAATAIGSQLIYSYANSAGSTTVNTGGAVIFAPAAVGTSKTVSFAIQNTGTSAATISSIGLTSASSIFSLQQLPSLPLSLSPNATVTFSVAFQPNNTGALTATMVIDGSNFTLTGSGTQPAALPAYQFQGASGSIAAAQQPSISLSLASPYPLSLQGTLVLTFDSSVFTDDPAIQFGNGSRTVTFTVPANTTQAVFSGNSNSIPLQTGTTAGAITITPKFTLQGGFDVTPSSPTLLSLNVARSAPQLLSGNIVSETANSFTLTLTGYSTTRDLSEFDIQLTGKQGTAFSPSQLSLNVSAASTTWFQSSASLTSGGSFVVAIPFNLQNGSTSTDLVHLIQSLNITSSNSVGASNSLSVPIP